MKNAGFFFIISCSLLLFFYRAAKNNSVTVLFILDHNRMLIDADMKRNDGSMRKARLWIDSGNPDFFMSKALARDLGIDLSEAAEKAVNGQLKVPAPAGVQINGMPLDFDSVNCVVVLQPFWLFSTMHNDANLPSTVLKKYHAVFDYPNMKITLARPGTLEPRGRSIPAQVNPKTGIVQIEIDIDKEKFSFALDNGASYSFGSEAVFTNLRESHPDWPVHYCALGCANIWGWLPKEESWPMIRLQKIQSGPVKWLNTGLVCPPNFTPDGKGMMDWYSQKTAAPVHGFLGTNALKAFRVEIDYLNKAVYFEKSTDFDTADTDIIGLTLRPEKDGSYSVIGTVVKDGKPAVKGVKTGDILLQVDGLKTAGQTMGTVIDALRGRPGDVRRLILERNGERLTIEARVERFLE